MIQSWRKIALVVVLILLPFIVGAVYRAVTALPKEVNIASGQPGGRFLELSQILASEIEKKLKIKAHIVSTNGSLDNLFHLQKGKVDFALYQAGSLEILTELDPAAAKEAGFVPLDQEAKTVAFIANLDSQPVHFVVRRDAGIRSPADLKGKTVSLGLKSTGNYPASLVLLRHFGLDKRSIQAKYLSLAQVKEGFLDNTLDAALISIGVQSPIFAELFETGKCDILSIPYSEALAQKYLAMSQYKIPAGRYVSKSPPAPATDIHSIALGVQLLTRRDVPTRLVQRVTELVLSEDFLKKGQLAELFAKGHAFALQRPNFAIHPGAESFYHPELRPPLDPDLVALLEHIRSFLASILIAAFLGIRWLRKKRVKEKKHRLDAHIEKLLDIQRRQVPLGVDPHGSDIQNLTKLLEEVALLRQDALRDLSARELAEDPTTDCFLKMCRGLGSEINAKISRQHVDNRFDELLTAMKKVNQSP